MVQDSPLTQAALLIIWHSRTGAARQMAEAASASANEVLRELNADNRVSVYLQTAEETSQAHVLAADAYLFCAPENLGSLSGTMKEFFDRTYYGVLDKINGRPYGVLIAAGSDGQGAARQVERICTGWRLRLAAPIFIANTDAQTPEEIMAEKTPAPEHIEHARTLGGTLAALLA